MEVTQVVARGDVGNYDALNLIPNKSYEVIEFSYNSPLGGYWIIDETGLEVEYHSSWFSKTQVSVILIDSDEEKLIFNDIKLEVGAYLDLRKHTVEQIKYLSKFYDVYNTTYYCEVSIDCFHEDVDKYPYLVLDKEFEFSRYGSLHVVSSKNKEYHFNDLFSEVK